MLKDILKCFDYYLHFPYNILNASWYIGIISCQICINSIYNYSIPLSLYCAGGRRAFRQREKTEAAEWFDHHQHLYFSSVSLIKSYYPS